MIEQAIPFSSSSESKSERVFPYFEPLLFVDLERTDEGSENDANRDGCVCEKRRSQNQLRVFKEDPTRKKRRSVMHVC